MKKPIVCSIGAIFLTSCSQPAMLIAGKDRYEQQGFQDGNGIVVRFKGPQIAYSEDSHKGLFIADYGNNRIRFMNTSGQVSTFAGNGNANQYPIVSGSEFALQSEIYKPSSIHISDNTLYFTSPGCLRSIDLGQVSSVPNIRTINGTCITQNDWLELQKPEISRALQDTKDPYYWGTAQFLTTDAAKNVYILGGSSLQRVSSNGVISQGNAAYLHAYGLTNLQNQAISVFYNNGGFIPGVKIITKVAEINSDNVSSHISDLDIGEAIKVISDGTDGYFAITGNSEYRLYKIDRNFKPTPMQTIRINGSPESLAYSMAEKALYIATVSAIYKVDLSRQLN